MQQAQSRLGFDEAVVRELMRGHELTAQLQAELRGQGQAEATTTTASILREMSRAFTNCISTMAMGSSSSAPPDATVAARANNKGDGVPRKRSVTSSPHSDGHQWRKYGQKKIMRTCFPRCYYRCRYHHERSCPATKQVQQLQQHGHGDPTMYLVTDIHDHTCHHTEPEAVLTDRLDISAGLPRQQQGGAKEELEQQALVSALVCVLQGRQCYSGSGGGTPEESSLVCVLQGRQCYSGSGGGTPEESPIACVLQGRQCYSGSGGGTPEESSLACVLQGRQCYSGSGGGTPEESSSQGCTGDGASASAAVSLDASDVGLHVMDYSVTDTVYFGTSSTYGLRDDGMLL